MARVVSGFLDKQVGADLGICEITVTADRGKVMRKMGADSLAEQVRMALRLRLPAVAIARPAFTTTRNRAEWLDGNAPGLSDARSPRYSGRTVTIETGAPVREPRRRCTFPASRTVSPLRQPWGSSVDSAWCPRVARSDE